MRRLPSHARPLPCEARSRHAVPSAPRTCQAAAKIAAELAPGSVVVDYTGAVTRRLPGALLAVQEVETSWGPVRMHAWLLGARAAGDPRM